MPLKPAAALDKDRRTTARLEHRHFAVIAQIISDMKPRNARIVAHHFVDRLARTNPKFDGRRFLAACGVD